MILATVPSLIPFPQWAPAPKFTPFKINPFQLPEERRRIYAFELWCWRRCLRIPWIARRSNQSILKEINLEHSLEGLVLKLKLQYFGHLMWRADSLEKILVPGKIEGRRRSRQQKRRCLDGLTTQWTWVWTSSRRWWRTERPGVLQSMGLQRVRRDWVTEQQ